MATLNLEPDAILPPERFVEAFVAALVDRDLQSISPREPQTRRALAGVVALMDRLINEFEAKDIAWNQLSQWVRTANSLRPSALGGVENWEHQFRAAQGSFTRVPNPSYEVVDFTISKSTARFELDQLTPHQRQLVEGVVDRFSSCLAEPSAA